MPDEDSVDVLLGRFKANKQYLNTNATEFTTTLSPEDEVKFQTWVKENKVPFEDGAAFPDYDMRGFYQGLMAGDPHAHTGIDPNDKQLHFSDYWKTPYHETFSNESKFATQDAPRWKGDTLVDKAGNVLFDDTQQGK